ncbi:hypothetical protein HQN90_08545 [Paenibacillus alba]|uniref:hypothetical protein n=1 Tax=Paenibacillus alba TaxID=1197127 RepID=UPI00156665AF|nr:hypothetical protein [Paenibacillus alba]
MLDKGLLEDGLIIISQCKKETGDIWNAHFGAAAIASYFFIKENNLPPDVERKVIAQARKMVKKHTLPYSSNGHKRSDISHAERIILESLDRTIDQLHWVGHNVIYAALSLLAIHELSCFGTNEDLTGISELVSSFDKTIPGRSWLGFSASDVKRLDIVTSDNISEINSAEQLSEFVLKELAAFNVIYRAESHHDLIAHMLTFSHALNILYDLGHVTYFKRGIHPLLKLVKVLRASRDIEADSPIQLISPVDRKPLEKSTRSPHLPIELGFWINENDDHDWDFGHQFKFPYSFYNHMNRVKEVDELSVEKFRYLVKG